MKIIGYIVVDRTWAALSLDIKEQNHFWRMNDDVTFFRTYHDAWNACRRFKRWLSKNTQLSSDIKYDLLGCKPLAVVKQ